MIYRVEQIMNYNELFLNLYVEIECASDEKAQIAANIEMNNFVLHDGYITYEYNGSTYKIEEKECNYQFQICTKDIKPVDLRNASEEELKKILSFEPCYITTDKDYKDVNLSLSEAYIFLSKAYKPKQSYKFDSLAYTVI